MEKIKTDFTWRSDNRPIVTVKRFEGDLEHALLLYNTIACTNEKTITITKDDEGCVYVRGNDCIIDGLGTVNCPDCLRIIEQPSFDKARQLSAIVVDPDLIE